MGSVAAFGMANVPVEVPSVMFNDTDMMSLDPLFVVQPEFTVAKMGQTNPWPGSTNTLKVTIESSVKLMPSCTTIIISKLQEACNPEPNGAGDDWDSSLIPLAGDAAASFKSAMVNGTDDNGGWLTAPVDSFTQESSLTLVPKSVLDKDTALEFEVKIRNPVEAQNSPAIMIECLGIPIAATLMDKEQGLPSGDTHPTCSEEICNLVPGDLAPLTVHAPMFLQKDVSQSTVYPYTSNTITVSLMSNIPLTVQTIVTISNLDGSDTPSGVIALDGADEDKFQEGGSGNAAQGAWNAAAKKLTLWVNTEIVGGSVATFSFVLMNPKCGQASPPVCVRASRISTPCLDCAAGECVTLERQAMVRDISVPSAGDNEELWGPGYPYSPGAEADINFGNASISDKFPLKVMQGHFLDLGMINTTTLGVDPIHGVSQSNFAPGADNWITVAFATNVPLRAAAGGNAGNRITITGLQGSQTNSTDALVLQNVDLLSDNILSVDFGNAFDLVGTWDKGAGELVVNVTADTHPGALYAFKFQLVNPACVHAAQPVTIKSDLCTDNMSLDPAPGNDAPLLVKAVELNAGAWQTNPYPNADNNITVRFNTTVDLVSGTKITIRGILGTVTASNNVTVMSDVIGDDDGSFSPSTGELVVELTSTLNAGQNHNVVFTVKNPSVCQPAKELTIGVSLGCSVEKVVEPVLDETKLADDIFNATDDESAPLLVRCPEWVETTIHSANDHPCEDNLLTVTLKVNVPIEAGVNITLTGLTGSRTPSKQNLTVTDTHTRDTVEWNADDGKLVAMTTAQFDAGVAFTVLPTLINPSQKLSTAPTVTVEADILGINSQTVAVEGDNYPLEVEVATFTTAAIAQSTAWPGAKNTITITLESNVPLKSATTHCPVQITIMSFDGAMCLEADVDLGGTDSDLFASGPNASHVGKARWLQDQHAINMDVIENLDEGDDYVITFQLDNPVEAQPSPLITVEASGIEIAPVVMEKTQTALADTTTYADASDIADFGGSSTGTIFDSLEGDAEPLAVTAPAFIERHISQTTNYPGAENTIKVSVRPNIDLTVGSVVTISVLNSADGTSARKTGSASLEDSAVGDTDLSGNADHEFFSSQSEGGDTGTGLWDDSARTMTLYVQSLIKAGQHVAFSFTLRNPLCAQDPEPACIRARNIEVGCQMGVTIPRRRMDQPEDTDLGPLSVVSSSITMSEMTHSNPWPSQTNTLTILFEIDVPVQAASLGNDYRVDPLTLITISGLTGTQGNVTNNVSLNGNDITSGVTFDKNTGKLVFPPGPLTEDTEYTILFDVVNRNCQQDAPDVNLLISGVCLAEEPVAKRTVDICGVNDSQPLGVRGGPCGGDPSTAFFTVKNVSQSTPYPGCENEITVKIKANTPIPKGSIIMLNFANPPVDPQNRVGSLVMGINDGNLTAENGNEVLSGANAYMVVAMWMSASNDMTLNVTDDGGLEACTDYEFKFKVQNPVHYQASMPVEISANYKDGSVIIEPVVMQVSSGLIDLPGADDDHKYVSPMEIQEPTFIVKNVSQSIPYPGRENTLTLLFSANMDLKVGSVVAFSGFLGASAETGSITIDGDDKGMFTSLDDEDDKGTWSDCEKTLFVKVKTALGCDGVDYSITFNVMNEVDPQPCVNVRINATMISVHPSLVAIEGNMTQITVPGSEDIADGVWAGFDMVPDLSQRPSQVYGAMKSDSCPMKIWPGAFIVKNVGQSSSFPCAENTITITLATNVPLDKSITFWDRPSIAPKITISRILNAVNDNPTRNNMTTLKDITVNTSYFVDSDRGVDGDVENLGSGTATWMKTGQAMGPVGGSEFSIEFDVADVFPEEGRRALDASECCLPKGGLLDDTNGAENRFVFEFTVYNPSVAQDPSRSVSISASGIPIVATALEVDGPASGKPMYVLEPMFIKREISQTSMYPCQANVLTIELSLNVPLYTRCEPGIQLLLGEKRDITPFPEAWGTEGLSNLTAATGTSDKVNQTFAIDSENRTISTMLISDVSAAETSIILKIDLHNPSNASMAAHLSVNIMGMNLQPTMLQLPQGNTMGMPGTVAQADFTMASISQSNPYPAASNTITIKIKTNVPLPGPDSNLPSCPIAITVSGLAGACHQPGQVVAKEGSSDAFSYEAGSEGDSKKGGVWNADDFAIVLHVAHDGMNADNEVEFIFDISNPTTGQESPLVFIEASGIQIGRREMERGTDEPPPDIYQGQAFESYPLEVRGQVDTNEFKIKDIGQSTAEPGQDNTITITFATNVPLTKENPASVITISGLAGASATLGEDDFTMDKSGAGGARRDEGDKANFDFVWDNDGKVITLTPTVDTTAGAEYVMTVVVKNPTAAQQSPDIIIQSSGIVIQPSSMIAATGTVETTDDMGDVIDGPAGSEAPLFVLPPRIVSREIHQTFCDATVGTAAFPGDSNCLAIKFKPTVTIQPVENASTVISITGLKGVVADEGNITITGSDAEKFSDCMSKNDSCTGSLGYWMPSRSTLILSVIEELQANTAVEIGFKFTNALHGQDPPVISIGMSSNAESSTFDISPKPMALPAANEEQEDKTALLIKHSAAFTTKKLSASTTMPGATSEMTLVFKPEYDLTGDKQATITVTGLVGSDSHDGTLLLHLAAGTDIADIKKFNSRAAWKKSTGTLVLAIAPGETVSKDADTTVKFDLVNPMYSQEGPSFDNIFISASGDVPLAAQMMDFDDGEHPLKVIAATFETSSIGSTSMAPGANNTLTVTFQADVTLSEARSSYIQVSGLIGSETPDTMVLPLYTDPTVLSVPTDLVSPVGEVRVTFTDECKLEDGKVYIDTLGKFDQLPENIGLVLSSTHPDPFTPDSVDACKGQSFVLTDMDSNGCYNIKDDGAPALGACLFAGTVEEFEIIEGGSGYKTGDVTISSGPGTMSASCDADSVTGEVTGITITFSQGMSPDSVIECASACGGDVGTCNADSKTEKSGRGLVVRPVIRPIMALLVAAEWHSASGSLRVVPRVPIVKDSPNQLQMFKFKLRNGYMPAEAVTASIFAGGLTPVRATVLETENADTLMKVSALTTAVTAVCFGSESLCTVNAFNGVPSGLNSYVLKVSRQCNGPATRIKFTVGGALFEVAPPSGHIPCSNDCSSYEEIFDYLDVKSSKPAYDGGELTLTAEVIEGNTDVDYCGTGTNIKFKFTLEYDEDDVAPAPAR